MQKNKENIKRSKQRIFRPLRIINFRVIVLCAASTLILIGSLQQSDWTTAVTSYICDAIDEITKPCKSISHTMFDLFQMTEDKKRLIKENKELKDEIQQYKLKYFDYQGLIEENEYLRSMVPIIEKKKFETITVIKKPIFSQPFVVVSYPSQEICKQIQLNAFVISPDGLVGTVVGKSRHKVIVRLITHIQSRIAVVSTQSHKKALLFGQNSPYFKIKYITNEADDNASFREKLKIENEFIEGEYLETDSGFGNLKSSIRVAQMVRNAEGKLVAQCISEAKDSYMTIIIDQKLN